ncbi:dethiobiotin synthase [Salegentibacter sp. F188]|uniref:ATP-dependent dethiobiotin synthetase BioD n=1 Tax=Autumnicola patrickiae TaxID=3075591 RepID=A0ABU3E424_9FLAO|nr:dethiobiotin synthase [Salegentibacter sp. F188]MDT0690739.1 dethiobiotin synthase [Salegentibacter sp. F188]
MKHKYFVTGIGTEVGKTIASAIITEALQADYWKPIQAGDLENSDTHKIEKLISNSRTEFHPNSFALKKPMSPHAAAAIDKVKITSEEIKEPRTDNHLVIEGAGGLLVPINDHDTIADLIKPDYRIILISRHYLGSINHTLLSLELLKSRGLECFGIIFSGDENPTSEEIIKKMGKVPIIGRIEHEPYFDRNVVKEYAEIFKCKL